MQKILINQNDADQRLDKFLQKTFPDLPVSAMYKYIRKKRIKINHKRAEISTRLSEGDCVELYIGDDFLVRPSKEDFQEVSPNITVVYEDAHILIVEKPFGMVVHEDANHKTDTLIQNIKAYLYQKGDYRPEEEHSFTPALCNRIDRNTAGLVIAAKSAEGLRIINQKIKNREIQKQYLCIVQGTPQPKEALLHHYLQKDGKRNKMMVFDQPNAETKEALTQYHILQKKHRFSLAEITLVTGRTHQIRAQMAAIGHPLLGDVKYGASKPNPSRSIPNQALYSYRIQFCFTSPAGNLEYLNGKIMTVSDAAQKIGWDLL